jgi:trigger factor
MNISKEVVNDLNAVIRIQFSPEDYQPKIDTQLKEYGKKVNMPGFRPGKVPSGMVKKMYGKSILVDELNKLTSDSLFNYIRDNQLDILGNPLPKPENDLALDLDNPGLIDFAFEVALAPNFSIDLSPKTSFKLYVPNSYTSIVDSTVEDYRQRMGKQVEQDVVTADSTVSVSFEYQLDGSDKLVHKSFNVSEISDEQLLMGLSKDARITINPVGFFKSESMLNEMLELNQQEAEALNEGVKLTIERIHVQEPAPLDQDFYTKMFGENKIFTELEMREKLESDIAKEYRKSSEMRFYNEVVEYLVTNTRFNLPDDFLKRWLVSSNEGKLNAADIETNYENYARGIRWQLIENKLVKENNLVVSQNEALDSLTDDFLNYMGASHSPDEGMLLRAREIASNLLKNEKEANRIYEKLYREKMNALFLNSYTIVEDTLTLEDWKTKMNEPVSAN